MSTQTGDPPLPIARAAHVQVGGLDGFLARIEKVRAAVGPVQALRRDRVLSGVHLAMAAEHARRNVRAGRARSTDPAVEFLLFAACDRQIHRAVAALGVVPEEGHDIVVVALEADDGASVARALAAAGLPPGVPFTGTTAHPEALAWWAERLDVPAEERLPHIEDRLLARMALLALERA